MGMAGDMFSSALIGLGVPSEVVTGAMERAARRLGRAKVQAQAVRTNEGAGVRLRIELEANDPHLSASDARKYLEATVREEGLSPAYADLARQTLEVLIAAEREAHSGGQLDAGELYLKPIGLVHAPYCHKAPSQPPKAANGEFYIELFPELAAGLVGLETDLVKALREALGLPRRTVRVHEPYQMLGYVDDDVLDALGVDIVGLSLDSTFFGFPADDWKPFTLFDGTPVVDIKPHVRTLDETDRGNDGWLADSDHLRLHQEGVPHQHATEEAILHEAQDILLDVIGAAKGLEFLRASLGGVVCLTPVSVGGGEVRFSHGTLPVPVPAVAAILKRYRIPHVAGPEDAELLTPTGAALLAALRPKWRPREMGPEGKVTQRGLGLGTRVFEHTNGLWLTLTE